MSDGSRIEWTEATWNPVTGCSKVSQGCKHCYAERDWKRLSANPLQPAYHGRKFTDVMCHPERLTIPILQARPRRIFVNSMSDLFHEDVPFEFIDQVFAVMACTSRHTYQVLTKRPARMLEYFESRCSGENFELFGFPDQIDSVDIWPQWTPCNGTRGGYDNCGPTWPLINVCLGVSVEDQETANERIPMLLSAPAAIRFISAEPLLGPIELCDPPNDMGEPRMRWLGDVDLPSKLDWVIAGGESGHEARPMHVDWVRSLRDQCRDAGAAFFFKQWGEWAPTAPEAGGDLGGDMKAGKVRIVKAVGENDGHLRRGDELMRRVGKKVAGRLLDGHLHDDQPKREPWPVE
jgi:protein gp37